MRFIILLYLKLNRNIVYRVVSEQVERDEVWRRVHWWKLHTEFHNEQPLWVHDEVCVAQWLARPVLTTCRTPASRLLQGHDCHSESRQASDAVWTRSEMPYCAYCLWSVTERRRRLGWPTQNRQVDNYCVTFGISWHVTTAFYYVVLVIMAR